MVLMRWFYELTRLRRAAVVEVPTGEGLIRAIPGDGHRLATCDFEFELSREVQAWCQENLRDPYGLKVTIRRVWEHALVKREITARAWFINYRDAVLFKLRWL